MKNFALACVVFMSFIFNTFVFTVKEGLVGIQETYDSFNKHSKKYIFSYGPGLYMKIPFFSDIKLYNTKSQLSKSGIYNININNNDHFTLETFILWKIDNNSLFFKKTGNKNIVKFTEYLQYDFYIRYHKLIKDFYKQIILKQIKKLHIEKKFNYDANDIQLIYNHINMQKLHLNNLDFNAYIKKNFILNKKISSNFGIQILDYGLIHFKFSENDLKKILNKLNMKYEKYYKTHHLDKIS
ncbi:hypothetical protein RJT30_01940 [Buchnera aphidicola (Mollitrichosiphum nigrofasciatum)]|uniref:SPFH domain-containing protein n=1 Tax=Buchnera aphidicola TaxID=9 RepID=UPI0031B87565